MRSPPGLVLAVLLSACGDGSGPARPDLGVDAAGLDAAGLDAGTGDAGTGDGGGACGTLGRQNLASGLGGDAVLATAPAGDDRVFVARRTSGDVRVIDATGALPTPYLAIPASALSTTGFEDGLLGLAFHAGFAADPRVFVSYTTPTHRLRVSSFRAASATAATVDGASEQTLLEIPIVDATHAAHIAGSLAFGPDHFLYIGVGDMQPSGDVAGVAQDLGQLAGKILRVDVDATGVSYAIPPGNPFVGMTGARGEVWAYGVREPFRFSFDATTGDLYVGDVGDASWEEVDVIVAGDAGKNLGWPIMEGMHCHTPATGCATTGLEPPVYEYPHTEGVVVLGGPVYRGTALPACEQGRYFFADYLNGWVRSFTWGAGSGATDVMTHAPLRAGMLVDVGTDGHGELLLVGMTGGVDRVVAR